MAELAFGSFCGTVISNIAPEWNITKPTHETSGVDLREIDISLN